MLTNNRTLFGILVIMLGLFLAFALDQVAYNFSPDARIAHCIGIKVGDEQVDCVYREIDRIISQKGIEDGFKIFSAAYDMFPSWKSVV